jgi:hypothetical protein
MIMKRRDFLSVASAATATAIAGCSSSESGEYPEITAADSGPPYYTKVNITSPDTVQVGEQFNYTVSAANTGGRTGNFTSTLSAGANTSFVVGTARINEIKPGTLKKESIGPSQFNETRELTVQIPEYGTQTTVTVEPAQISVDDTITLDGKQVEITDITYQQSFYYRDGDKQHIFAAGANKILALVSIRSEAVRTIESGFPSADGFTIHADSETIERANKEFGDEYVPEDSKPYEGSSEKEQPGARREGVLIYEVPADASEVSIGWSHGFSSGPDVYWELDAEAMEQFNSSPAFDVANLSIPSEVGVGRDVTGSVTIENTGGSDGRFLGSVDRRDQGNSVWKDVKTIEQQIPAGDQAEIEFDMTEPGLGPSEYRVFPLTEINTVDYVTSELDFGETFDDPVSNASYSVNEIRLGDTLRTQSLFSDEYTEEELESGNQWAFVRIEVFDTEDSTRPDNELTLLAGDRYEPVSAGSDFKGDVSGETYDPDRTGVNRSPSGWLVYEIPDSYSVSGLTFSMTQDLGFGTESKDYATWSSKDS